MVKNYLVFGIALIFVVFLSGCLGMSPEALAFANPLVKQFMSEYPNAQIQVTHFTAEQVTQMLENISSECGNPYMEAKDMYRITIDDPDSGLRVISWIDWENREIECAVKYGTGEDKSISKPGEPIKTCKSHAEFRCYGEHVFWFDSCGHKQEKKEYCQEGCELGFCREREIKTCEEMGGYCVYPEVVPAGSLTGMVIAEQPLLATQDVFCGWSTYHECESNGDCAVGGCSGEVCGGVNEDLTTTCEYKDCYNAEKFGAFCECYEGKCRWSEARVAKPMCVDSDNGKNYHEKGYVFTGESKVWDHCNDDGTLTEKYCTKDGQMAAIKVSCPEGGKCGDGICVGGEGETSEEEEVITELVCEEGYAKAEYWCPENGICCAPKEVECEAHHQYKCYEGHVFWFDSCGNRQEKKEYCEHGCFEGECKTKPVEECVDSDGGKNYHEWGTATKGDQSLSDHCNEDGTLTEKYCENNEIKAEKVECPEGYECLEGECVEKTEQWCEDSDEGKNYYVKGTVEEETLSKTDCCAKFFEGALCYSSGPFIKEYFCDNDQIKESIIDCPEGICVDGVCVNATKTCSEQEGVDCGSLDKICKDEELPATDTWKCCLECEEIEKDLTITEITVEEETGIIYCHIKNNGNWEVSNYRVELLINDKSWGYTSGSHLEPGEVKKIWGISSPGIEEGENSIKFVVDSLNQIDEINENNNELTITYYMV